MPRVRGYYAHGWPPVGLTIMGGVAIVPATAPGGDESPAHSQRTGMIRQDWTLALGVGICAAAVGCLSTAQQRYGDDTGFRLPTLTPEQIAQDKYSVPPPLAALQALAEQAQPEQVAQVGETQLAAVRLTAAPTPEAA